MNGTGVTVLGVNELLGKFLRTAVAGEVAALEGRNVVADEVAASARSYAPVATGALRDSIDVNDGVVSTSIEYAPFVEYGTSTNPAQPFMRPAADTADGEHAELVTKAIVDRVA